MSEAIREVFIGARTLGEQVGYILPTYKLILEQIEYIRTAAFQVENTNLKGKRENNNVIGIFGARGTGKTSILYTIEEELKSKEDYNIILPIIEPDSFGENTKIMGSIVGMLSDVVDNELKIIKSNPAEGPDKVPDFFRNCIYDENNVLIRKRKELLEYYFYTETEYRTLVTATYNDIPTYIKKSSYLLMPDIKFKEKLMDLIDEIIKTRKERLELKKGDEEPLILLFFDDIDLKTTKCKELIDSILQYMNHPNIVSFISGDYEILKESIVLALLREEDIVGIERLMNRRFNASSSIIDTKKTLATEYLKKIIPPARRHNVVNWNENTIPKFSFDGQSLSSQLDRLLTDKKDFFNYRDPEQRDENNVSPIEYAYRIFDKTPRGLINVYYHISLMVGNKEKNEFQNIKALIDTIVISSGKLVGNQEIIFSKYLLWGDDEKSTFIDYMAILNDYNNMDIDLSKEINIEKDTNLFIDYFIILQLLLELTEGVNYNQEDYERFKNLILERLYGRNRSIRYYYNLGEVVFGIAKNLEWNENLLLLKLLTASQYKRVYYFNNRNLKRNEIYEKTKNTFMAISKIVKYTEERDILKELYLKAYNSRGEDDKQDELSILFNFLQDISATPAIYSRTENIFESLLDKLINRKPDNQESEEESIKEMLIINMLSEISILDESKVAGYDKGLLLTINSDGSEKNSEENKKNKQYRSWYNYLKRINEDYKNGLVSAEKKEVQVKKIIGKLADDLKETIEQNLLYYNFLRIRDNSLFRDEKDLFFKPTGESRTVFEGVKKRIKDKNMIDWNEYKVVFKEVQGLSRNNRVWYGKFEAIRFLSILKKEIVIDINNFGKFIPTLNELSIYLERMNPNIQEDKEYGKEKGIMAERLKKAIEDAMNEVSEDLGEIEISLEEDERIDI